MRTLPALLRIASLTLAVEHRERWREEALAVLLAVRGRRRWWYAFDTVLKAPALAWQHRRSAHPDAPGLRVAVPAGLGLLCVPVLALGSVGAGPWHGPDGVLLGFLLSPVGLLPAVAARSFGAAARAGGGRRRLAFAALVTLSVAAGPLVAAVAATATGRPVAGLAGAAAPGVWLAGVSALRHRTAPAGQSFLGILVGAVLAFVPIALQLGATGSPTWLTPVGTLLLGVVLLPTLLAWALVEGLRTLAGRLDVVTAT